MNAMTRENLMASAKFHGKILGSVTISPNPLWSADLGPGDLGLQGLSLKKKILGTHGTRGTYVKFFFGPKKGPT